MSTQQCKRLRKNSAASISDVSEKCNDKVQEINVFSNSSDDELAEEIEGDAPPVRVPKHSVNTKTVCWLFFDMPAKGIENKIMNCKHLHHNISVSKVMNIVLVIFFGNRMFV